MEKGLHILVCVKVGVFCAKPGGTAGNDPVPAFEQCGTGSVFLPVRQKERKENTMANKEIPYKIYLEESEMPKAWYNLRADMKNKP